MAIDINIPSQVKNYANLAAFPATGSLKTIFIAEDTNKTYRWTGSAYVEISASQAAAWGTITGTLSSQTDLQTALNAKVTGNTAITGATKTKVTYDSKGLVTAGADATTADIADSTNKRYVTDANLTVIGNTSGTNTGDQTLSGLGGVPTSRTLTINGTTQDLSADRTFTVSTGITIGTTAITSGTVGRVLFEGTGNVVQESANLFWDNTNGRLGIGTSSPSYDFDLVKTSAAWVIGRIRNLSSAGECTMTIANDVNQLANYSVFGSAYSVASLRNKAFLSCATTNGFSFSIYDNSSTANFSILTTTSLTERMRVVGSTGNVLINTTTDAGFKLDVNGTARATSFTIGTFNVLDYGNGCRLNYASGAQKVNIYSNTSGGGLTLHNSGNASIGSEATEVTSAILNVPSTTKGFLPPRMTTTQKNAIATPATGLMVYDTTLNLISVYNGTTWITL